MKPIVSLALGLIVVVAMGMFVYARNQDAPVSVPVPVGAQEPVSTTYTMSDISAHATAESCWSVINGNVYDLTSWIPEHPGGPRKITQLCGIDGSAKFNGQHGGQAPMETVLAGFRIGSLNVQ